MGAKSFFVAKSLNPVKSDAGVTITPNATFETCPRDLTVLFTPVGTDSTLAAAVDPETRAFIADRGARAKYVTSVWRRRSRMRHFATPRPLANSTRILEGIVCSRRPTSLMTIPRNLNVFLLSLFAAFAPLHAQQVPVKIRFAAQVNGKPFECGQTYQDIGTAMSQIKPRDFRFYVSHVRLVDSESREVPVTMDAGTIWQADDTSLLDFENATGSCINGTPEMNDTVAGTVPAGHTWKALRFNLGVPFEVNHLELTSLPSPLNLTALSWVWNAGHKFARIEFMSKGLPAGFFIHLGSTGCTPDTTRTTIPTKCAQPNRPDVEIQNFNPDTDVVVADLGALLADSNVDVNAPKTPSGCMSFPGDPECVPIFAHLGLPYGDKQAGRQDFFHKAGASMKMAKAF